MEHNIRSSDVFLKADVAALLRALALTAQMLSTAESAEFVRGYLSAIAAVATALNIKNDNGAGGVVVVE